METEYISRKELIVWLMPYVHTGEKVDPEALFADIRAMRKSSGSLPTASRPTGTVPLPLAGCLCWKKPLILSDGTTRTCARSVSARRTAATSGQPVG